MNQDNSILVYSSDHAKKYETILREAGYTSVKTAVNPEEAEEKLPGTEILFCWNFPTSLLSLPSAKSIRWIQPMKAGVDDLVNDPNLPEDVLLTRVTDQFGGPIAEYVFAYLLYISKDIDHMLKAQKERKWDPFLTEFLTDKTIGIAGLGSIGVELVRKARAFDMEVYGLSYSGKNAELVDKHFYSTEWLSFAANVDVLVLTLPLTKETEQIVSDKVLQQMKSGSWLINVGRGNLVSEPALISALSSGHLGGAVLDVFATEPLPPESELWTLPNVYVTPHISGPSRADLVGDFFVDNLNRYVSGEALKGVVHRDLGY